MLPKNTTKEKNEKTNKKEGTNKNLNKKNKNRAWGGIENFERDGGHKGIFSVMEKDGINLGTRCPLLGLMYPTINLDKRCPLLGMMIPKRDETLS